MFEVGREGVWKRCHHFNVNVGSGPIKIHIHPVLKLLIRREEGIY